MTQQTEMPETHSADKPASSPKKYGLLALLVLVVAAGWSAFWYYSYTKTQGLIDRLMAQQSGGQSVLACENQHLGGYPFRLHLTCSSYEINHPRTGWTISGKNLRAVWQVYAPNLAVVELEERLTAMNAYSGESFDIISDLMRGSVRLSPTEFVARASFEANNPTFSSNNPSVSRFLGDVTAQKISFHARPTPDKQNDLDISVAGTEVTTANLPIVTGQLSFTALDGLSQAIRSQGNPARAWLQQSGQIKNIDGWLEIGQKTLKLNGDVGINKQGLANGVLKLKILNPSASNASASSALDPKRDGLNGPLTALQLMGKPTKDGDLIGSEVEIKLTDGQVSAGILPVGNLPPIR